ncbi:MAG: ABC transporter permease [Burkholderiales bacterium]
MLHKLLACASKEMRVLARDPEGLAILFLMPVVFVVVMSLALQDFFHQGTGPKLDLVVLDGDGGSAAEAIAHAIDDIKVFRSHHRAAADYATEAQQLREDIRAGRLRFALLLPPGITARHTAVLASGGPREVLDAMQKPPIAIELLADPALRADHRAMATMALERTILGVESSRLYQRFAGISLDRGQRTSAFEIVDGSDAIKSHVMPTSTQQNVPAYSVLAMFLLVIPLSGAFIRERYQGSLTRLRSMPVPGAIIIGGKVLPFFAINLLQMGLCLAVGRFLLPLLGGTPLQFSGSAVGIVLLTAAVSLAAIGFGLVVAMFARTPEQATAFGATAILLFAALGGIMVPKLLMPSALQTIAEWSPLGWALDGFLDLFVRGASAADVLPRAIALVAFGAGCFALAMARFGRLARAP